MYLKYSIFEKVRCVKSINHCRYIHFFMKLLVQLVNKSGHLKKPVMDGEMEGWKYFHVCSVPFLLVMGDLFTLSGERWASCFGLELFITCLF